MTWNSVKFRRVKRHRIVFASSQRVQNATKGQADPAQRNSYRNALILKRVFLPDISGRCIGLTHQHNREAGLRTSCSIDHSGSLLPLDLSRQVHFQGKTALARNGPLRTPKARSDAALQLPQSGRSSTGLAAAQRSANQASHSYSGRSLGFTGRVMTDYVAKLAD